MKPQKRIGYFLTIVAIFVLSCDVSTLVAPQTISTSAPGSINTIVAQTAAAAATQTAVLNPPSAPEVINTIVVQTAAVAATRTAALIPPTVTPTFTPFPTKTASVTPSPTQTFVFKLPTAIKPTKTKTPSSTTGGGSSGGGGGGSTTTNWSCSWVSQTPSNSTHFAPGTSFSARWTVTNTGDVTWLHTTVDIVYSSGSKLSSQSLYDTTADTGVGSAYVVSVPMTAPSTAGTYSMTWSLQAGVTTFCSLPLTIIVP